jgi:hypothetical protein
MLRTCQQWRNDSWKTIGIRDSLLRKIDNALAAYHGADGVHQRTHLANVFAYCYKWVRDNPSSSRLAAVTGLRDEAENEMTVSGFNAGQIDELRRASAGQQLPIKRITLRISYTQGVARNIPADRTQANHIWGQASIVVLSNPPAAVGANINNNLVNGTTLGYQAEVQLVAVANASPTFIHICYAPIIGGDDAAGKTERPDSHPGHLLAPLVKIGANLCSRATLAHELGHALLNDGTHFNDRHNLMAAGFQRLDTQLTPGQIVIARASPYAH